MDLNVFSSGLSSEYNMIIQKEKRIYIVFDYICITTESQ